jgi:hypothetical protein
MTKPATIPVRVSEEFRDRLQAEAQAVDRPVSSLVRVLLQEALTKRSETASEAR